MTNTRSLFSLLLFICSYAASAGIGTGALPTSRNDFTYLDRIPKSTRLQPHSIIVKFKEQQQSTFQKSSVNLPDLSPLLLKYGVRRTIQMYPTVEATITARGQTALARMYRVEFTAEADPIEVAKDFYRMSDVEYAEPEVIHEILFIPNDQLYTQQYALQNVKAPQAWDITKGDPNVVIGIVDTGVDWTHSDLASNIWINPGEDANHDGRFTQADLNSKDDDANGFIDDIIGIDFAGQTSSGGGTYYDYDPQPTGSGNPHGTHVAGIAAASGNNSIGICGVAYQCKILPVKCGTEDGSTGIVRGYDGIVYAANMGAKIINCSWGGGPYLRSEEEQIEYAVSKGALVVAAAGNANTDDFSSPASYPIVFSVANVNQNDQRDWSSSYGTWVDVAAPGVSVLSTVPGNNYQSGGWTGTSMSSPCVAGVAALVKSKFPNYTPLQVAEQVRVTSDNIDAKNPNFIKKLGFGRVNASRALTLSLPSVRMVKYDISDKNIGNGNGILDPGERVTLTVDWKNYLAPTSNAEVTLTSTNSFVTITQKSFTIGQLNTDQTISNSTFPFVIEISQTVPFNQRLDFVFNIVDGSYQDYDGFSVFARPTYRDHDVNDITMTLSNDGNLGFDDFTGLRGSGFMYQKNGHKVMFEGALMIAGRVNNQIRVVDQARDSTGSSQLVDFVGDNSVVMVQPGKVAAQEGFASWTDNNARSSDKLGVHVDLHSYEFNEAALRNIVFLRYSIRNTSSQPITNLHAGLFFDWDISKNATNDRASWDDTTKTGYAWDISQANLVPTRVGVTVLTREKTIHYMAINNPDKTQGPIFGIHDGFTKQEKWRSMTSGILQKNSYVTDIAMVNANGPFTLAAGDSCEVAFALLAGLTNDEIIAASKEAQKKWSEIVNLNSVDELLPEGLALDQNYPNPFSASAGASTVIPYSIPNASSVTLEILDTHGRVVRTLTDEKQEAGSYRIPFEAGALPSGTYFSRLSVGKYKLVRRMSFIR